MSSREEIVTLSDIDLDEAIASEVLKLKILGRSSAWYCEDSWMIAPAGNHYSSVIRPVQFQWDNTCHCDLKRYKEMELEYFQSETPEERENRYKHDFYNGHETICVTAVPFYSQWLEEALAMVRVFKPCSFSLTYVDRLWVAEINDAAGTYTTKMPGELHNDKVAARVICCSALKAVRKLTDPKQPSMPKRLFSRLFVCSIVGHDEWGFGGSYGWKCRRCDHEYQ